MKHTRPEEYVYVTGQSTRETDACIEHEKFEDIPCIVLLYLESGLIGQIWATGNGLLLQYG
jgi:hypothetical protein